MTIWIARDSDLRLYMFFSEPFLDNISGGHWQTYPYQNMINIETTPLAEMFKNLKFSDKPIRMKMFKAKKNRFD